MEEQVFLKFLEGAVEDLTQEVLPLAVFFPLLHHSGYKVFQTLIGYRQFQQGEGVPVAGKEKVEKGQLPDFNSSPAALKKS